MGTRAPTVPERVYVARPEHLTPPPSARIAVGSSPKRLPEQFGKYSILGHLATGGMAEVYVARQAGLHGLHKTVVLKRVRPEMMDGDTLSSFLDEARLVAELEHPNIAQVYEIGQIDESYFFVMEYVNGADLRQLMECAVTKGIRVSLGEALSIIMGICAALHYAHERCDFDGHPLSIVHRDVSPSNVLISHDGAIKVCDFGIAKARNRSTETVRGMIKGKFAYMSPEQCRCQPLDRRSDIFSIGILLYELTTLSRAFSASNDFDLLRAIIEGPIEPPSKRLAGYPPELERIVLRALAKDPDHRYATAQEMQLDLEMFARENKLAVSAIDIAALMDRLFDKRIDGWLRAQREGCALADQLPDIAVMPTDPGETFPATGTEQSRDITICEDMATGVRELPAVAAPKLENRALWLVGAVAAVVFGVGASVAEVAARPAAPDAAAFEPDARAIAAALDTAVRGARLRVDGVASTPMLRAAIETDAATVADLARNERLITPAPREVIEISQLREGQTSSLLRIPAGAPALKPVSGREARVETDGRDLFVIVAAPIPGSRSQIGGTLSIAMPIDLAPIERLLAGRVSIASIAGLASDVPLARPRGPVSGAPLQIPIPVAADPGSPSLALVVVPASIADAATWGAPIRYASFALALALLAGYVVARIRAARAR